MLNLKDVTVIIPTYNANGPLLSEHIDGLNRWIADVGAVIIVDSESSDGTVEFIREHLSFPNARYFTRPRGLYQSWNFAVEQVATKYLYMATVGDVICPDGVSRLLETIERFDGDLVVSPPAYVDAEGNAVESKRWPVDRMIKMLGSREPCRLDPSWVCTLHTILFPATLAGSSASNLYRSDFLQNQLFSTEFHNQGDSAWAVLVSGGARWCLHPETVAKFVFHPRVKNPGSMRLSNVRSLLLENVRESISKEPVWREVMNAEPVASFFQVLEKEELFRFKRCKLRQKKLPWYLSVSGWRIHQSRKRLKKERRVKQAIALEWLRGQLQYNGD